MRRKIHPARRGYLRWVLAAAAVLLLLACGAGLVFVTRPDLAAQGADALRAIFGDEAVARLEMVLFQAQDTIQQIKYSFGFANPVPPWQSAGITPQATYTRLVLSQPTSSTQADEATLETEQALPTAPLSAQVDVQQTSAGSAQQTSAAGQTPDPSVTPAPAEWQPEPLTPLGDLEGEGTWSAYIQDASGRTVAYRTFLQPDPARPFAVVGVIAFDLRHTRLHYILGFEEPYSPGGPARSGAMPEADKAPHFLLAMFNGGFKATHGHFGAMADGVTALPARDGLGTLVLYQDGRVRMGVWGSSIRPSADMECWRQNGPLVVQDGQINPRIYNNDPKDWGYTVKDVSPTWRSGLGLSADSETLYYFSGPSLTMEALAKSMLGAGAAQGMQLDINTYWVHFVAVRDQGDQRTLEPLFPGMMKDNISRYLYPYSRDYFYVTGTGPE